MILFPEIVASLFLVVLMIQEMTGGKKSVWATTQIGAFFTLVASALYWGKSGTAFSGMFALDTFACFFKIFFSLIVFFLVPVCREFFEPRSQKSGEFFLILWSTLIGLFFLVSARDLLLLFVALEIVTLSFYIMAAYLKRDLLSIEAGLKYLVLGSLASAFMVYGIAMIYVSAGTTSMPALRDYFAADPSNKLMLFGILLMISALGFKVASVPFQLWVPDVYEGAPTPVVAFLAVGSKAAGFAVLLRLLFGTFPDFSSARVALFSALAAMTILYGNLGALLQTNIKRLFGYSSIGHAGYLLIGIAAGQAFGATAVLYYLIAYAVTNLAAFYVISAVGSQLKSDKIEDYRGLAKRSPFLAATLLIALLSLAGVPPLAGFFGKFLVLMAGVKSGISWVVITGILAVSVSLFYYLSIVRVMYFEKPLSAEPVKISDHHEVMLAVLVLLIIVVGFIQAPFYSLASAAASSLF